ncbi:MAG: VWA domain-containing protein [bacterium]|nr:VWA domain-containing protein [bacterium]
MRYEPGLSSRAAAVAASLLILSFVGSALATQPTDDIAGVFGEVIDVRVVNLEVVVTDSEGRRVEGLAPKDFVLYVDGRQVPIEYFTEVLDGAAVTAGVGRAAAAVPALEAGGAVRTNYLVFIDEYFTLARDRDRAVDELIEQLTLLGAADRMAILAWNGGKLELLSNWSGSVDDLRQALETARGRPTKGLQREVELRQTQRGSMPGRYGSRYGHPEVRYRAQRRQEHVERVIQAATTALRGFARPPGRRAMLLLAGGWPYNPWDTVVVDTFAASRFSPSLGYGPCLYRQLYDTANRLGYTLYPVDLRGFGGGLGPSAEHRTSGQALYHSRLATNREWSEHSTLDLLAYQTGGRSFLNRERRTALEQVVHDTRSYYWLGFTPTWRGSNRRHRLEIQVRDPRLEVRSRRSFSDLSRRTEIDMLVESALLFGDPPGPKVLAAELGEPRGAGFRKVEVPLVVLIPFDALTFLPSRAGWTAVVELRVAVEDKNGDRNEIVVVPVRLDLPEPPERGGLGRYHTALKMRRLRHDVVISVHDPYSARNLWTRVEFDPRA